MCVSACIVPFQPRSSTSSIVSCCGQVLDAAWQGFRHTLLEAEAVALDCVVELKPFQGWTLEGMIDVSSDALTEVRDMPGLPSPSALRMQAHADTAADDPTLSAHLEMLQRIKVRL